MLVYYYMIFLKLILRTLILENLCLLEYKEKLIYRKEKMHKNINKYIYLKMKNIKILLKAMIKLFLK